MDRKKLPQLPKPRVTNEVIWGLLAAFLLAALVTAYLTFTYMRGLASQPLNPVPTPAAIKNPPAARPSNIDVNAPLQSASGPVPQPWDGASRVTILFMGLDYRENEPDQGPSRTDTMILFTLDPSSRTIGILSIPRDLWVDIPGYGYSKINTAYFYGEADQVPGGGPGLAVQTVQQFLGVPINYYAQVDFSAFVKFINELGGIEVNVPEEIEVDPIGPNNTVYLQPGKQVLKGAVALAYARARNTAGSDFDRAARQQQVILAIRDRILNMNMLDVLIQKAPILYQQLASGVHTNLSLQQVISLAWIAKQIPEESIKQGIIGPNQVTEDFSYDGQAILRPNTDEIRLLRDQIFTTTGPALPVATETADPAHLMATENAAISVLNGTSTAGLAARTTDYLSTQNLNVTVTDNAQEIYQQTTIIDYTGKIYTIQYVSNLMNIPQSQIYHSYNPNSNVDIAIILGNDWAANNKLP